MRSRQVMIADKNYYGRGFETTLTQAGVELLRPARKGEPARAGARFFRPLSQTIESIFDTAKGQLDLEGHGGHTITGVAVRVHQGAVALRKEGLARRRRRARLRLRVASSVKIASSRRPGSTSSPSS